jgi:hypothetical protein
MDKQNLIDYLKDYYSHFEHFPGDYEDENGKVYDQLEYMNKLTNDEFILIKLNRSAT